MIRFIGDIFANILWIYQILPDNMNYFYNMEKILKLMEEIPMQT